MGVETNWRLSGRGVDTTLETKRQGSGDDSGDLLAGDLRRKWRLSGRGLETTLVKGRDDSKDLGAGYWRLNWRLNGWEMKATLET